MNFRNVPFKYVPLSVRKNLAQMLDVRCNVFAADWTILGAEIGLTFVEKKLMEEQLDGNKSNTMALFESWSNNPQNTVGKILDTLEKIKRPHEVQKLNEAKDEILRSYFDSADADSIFQLFDKPPHTSELSVDLPSEMTSYNDPYYLNSYERFPSNVFSEEQNSRQLTHSIPDTSSLVDSRLGSSLNDFVVVEKNCNRTHYLKHEKIVNCGAVKDQKSIRVFITYGNGDQSHDSRIYHLCKFLDKKFFCNVDMKNKRIAKSKVDEYYNRADFVLICFDQEYMNSIKPGNLDKEEKPDKLHTAHIYSKMIAEAKSSSHRFIFLIFKGGNVNHIPSWASHKYFRCPEQCDDLSSFLNNPPKRYPFQ